MSNPQPMSRRDVLHTATLLGVSAFGLAAGLASEAKAQPAKEGLVADSGLITGQLKPLKYKEIPGLLTEAQVTPHYNAHYGGALKRYVTVEQQLDTLVKGVQPLGGDAYTLLQKDKLGKMNSVILHELYFTNIIAKSPAPAQDISAAITQRWGTLDRWIEDFKACAMAANGWGILARDQVNGKLYNVASDLHEIGVIWLGQPLIICDVYEHAFYVDYQNRKGDYVNKFVQFLDWDEINRRYQLLAR